MTERPYLRSWFYWVTTLAGLGVAIILGGFFGALVFGSDDALIGSSIAAVIYALYETWQVGRHPTEENDG